MFDEKEIKKIVKAVSDPSLVVNCDDLLTNVEVGCEIEEEKEIKKIYPQYFF